MRAVAPWHGGWVAIGSVDTDAAQRTAAIWTSADGLAWQRVSGRPRVLGSAGYGIAADGDRLVAVGSAAGGDTSAVPGPAVAWTSSDGARWTAGRGRPPSSAGPMR